MKIRTRQATLSDCDAIARLLHQGDRLHARLLPEFFTDPLQNGRSLESIAEIITHQACDYLLAEAEGPIVGVASVRVAAVSPGSTLRSKPCAILDHMVVDESRRGCGVGKALLNHAQLWALQHHLRTIQITVWSANTDAVQFYRSQGFEQVSQKMELRVDEAT